MNVSNGTLRVANEQKPTSKILKAGGGSFYSGMTLQDAKDSGLDKCFFRRDFSNLDKDGDNILSNEEIMREREREVKVLKADSIILGLCSIAELVFVCTAPKISNVLVFALATAITFSTNSVRKKNEKLNEELRKEFFA